MSLERALPILLYSAKFPEIKTFSVKLHFLKTCIPGHYVLHKISTEISVAFWVDGRAKNYRICEVMV